MATSNTLPDARCNSRRRSLLTPKISGTPSTQSNQRANRSYFSEICFVVSSVAIFLKNFYCFGANTTGTALEQTLQELLWSKHYRNCFGEVQPNIRASQQFGSGAILT